MPFKIPPNGEDVLAPFVDPNGNLRFQGGFASIKIKKISILSKFIQERVTIELSSGRIKYFMKLLRQLLAILILPFMVLVLTPTLILKVEKALDTYKMSYVPVTIIPVLVGSIFIILGLILLVITIRLFVKVGRGTLAPWDHPENLVVQGPYHYVRNPMISSVIFILLGESLLFGSVLIFTFAISFLAVNHLYFILIEEPGLIRRFAREYQNYRQNVPRWIPRFSPWHPGNRDEY